MTEKKTTTKQKVIRRYPGAFCTDLTSACLETERGYVVYNHGELGSGGYQRIGFAKTVAGAWKSALVAL